MQRINIEKAKVNKRKKKNKKIELSKRIFLLLIAILFIVVLLKILHKNNILKINYDLGLDDLEITEESSFPDEVYGIKVHTKLVDENTKERPGIKRKIKYLVIHETDNFGKTATAENHSNYLLENQNKNTTSWHYTVDEKEIYHHIPDNEEAYHAGTDEGNKYGVGIELCVNEGSNFDKTMENGAKLVAYLLKEYDLSIKDIKMHNDFSGKDCPHKIREENRFYEFKSMVKKFMENN